jgi:hypothetical protein
MPDLAETTEQKSDAISFLKMMPKSEVKMISDKIKANNSPEPGK